MAILPSAARPPQNSRGNPAAAAVAVWTVAGAQSRPLLQPADLFKLQAVGDVQLSPAGSDLAYSVISNEGPGRPTASTWLRERFREEYA